MVARVNCGRVHVMDAPLRQCAYKIAKGRNREVTLLPNENKNGGGKAERERNVSERVKIKGTKENKNRVNIKV